MSEPKQQKPRGVLGEEPLGIFTWFRDKLYDVVYSEGDIGLQFMADIIRGPEPVRETKHLNRQVKYQAGKQQTNAKASPKPLSDAEQKIFVDILKRKPSEKQVPYWKRKKALLNNPGKRELVQQYTQAQKRVARQKDGTIEIDAGHLSMPVKQKQSITKARKR